MKKFLTFMFALLVTVGAYAEAPMPLCECVWMGRIGAPIMPPAAPSEQIFDQYLSAPGGIYAISWYIPELPYSIPIVGWMGGLYPGMIPGISVKADIVLLDGGPLAIQLFDVACCDGVYNDVTPIYRETLILDWSPINGGHVYKTILYDGIDRWEYVGWVFRDIYGLYELELWEVKSVYGDGVFAPELVVGYRFVLGPGNDGPHGPNRPWHQQQEAQVE